MAPFNLPWSTFGAFVVLAATIMLAVVWALWDRSREGASDHARDGSSDTSCDDRKNGS